MDSDAEAGDNTVMSPSGDKPPIPSALQSAAEVNATPLPTLSMLVLSIVRPKFSEAHEDMHSETGDLRRHCSASS